MELRKALQEIALSKAVADKDFAAARKALPDGAVEQVEVWAHIKGTVTKGHATTSAARMAEAECNLRTGDVMGQVLRELGVTPADLRRVLRKIVKRSLKVSEGAALGPELAGANDDLLAVFDQVGQETAAKLPRRRIPGSSVDGSVRFVLDSVEISESRI